MTKKHENYPEVKELLRVNRWKVNGRKSGMFNLMNQLIDLEFHYLCKWFLLIAMD